LEILEISILFLIFFNFFFAITKKHIIFAAIMPPYLILLGRQASPEGAFSLLFFFAG